MGYGGIKWNIIEYMQHVVNNNQQYDIWVTMKIGALLYMIILEISWGYKGYITNLTCFLGVSKNKGHPKLATLITLG